MKENLRFLLKRAVSSFTYLPGHRVFEPPGLGPIIFCGGLQGCESVLEALETASRAVVYDRKLVFGSKRAVSII